MNFRALSVEMKIAAVCAGVSFLGFLLGWNLLIQPDLKSLESFKVKRGLESKKREADLVIEAQKTKIKSYEKNFSPAGDVSWAIESVTELAKKSGLTVTSMSPAEPEKKGDFDKLSLKVEADCGYHELGKFVSLLESSDRFLKVSALNAKRLKSDSPLKVSIVIEMIASAETGPRVNL